MESGHPVHGAGHREERVPPGAPMDMHLLLLQPARGQHARRRDRRQRRLHQRPLHVLQHRVHREGRAREEGPKRRRRVLPAGPLVPLPPGALRPRRPGRHRRGERREGRARAQEAARVLHVAAGAGRGQLRDRLRSRPEPGPQDVADGAGDLHGLPVLQQQQPGRAEPRRRAGALCRGPVTPGGGRLGQRGRALLWRGAGCPA
mmetsp:Transcript_76769/g.217218  ORF Transcript_76769/g.217218 Transcript_76769/m.217218 type:complete len:203 (-) Transcript_76769:220-828(-)